MNIREHLSTNTGGKVSDFWKQYWEFSICDGHFDTRNLILNISEVQNGKLNNRQKRLIVLLQDDMQGLFLNLLQ